MTERTPVTLLGDLFATVQERGLFPDSKTFADAVPLHPVDAINRAWAALQSPDDAALRAFVDANFELPQDPDYLPPEKRPLAEFITALWPALTRPALDPPAGSSALALPERHVVPGGRFREMYYWDSYFTMLGLARAGRQDLVEDMIANFGSLINRYGHIPNGTRTYYLSRSHPPLFYLMCALSKDASEDARRKRLDWMLAEHRFWMEGSDALAPGGEHRRVVRLPDGALLNRYWDDRATPRDESWREDVELAADADRPGEDLWRDLRAAAESGWDFSSRWFGDGRSLATVRTTRLVPIDLNAILYGLERAIAAESRALGDTASAVTFDRYADDRRDAVNHYLWNGRIFADYDLDTGRANDRVTAAQGFALFTGIAAPDRATGAATSLRTLLRPGGLLTTSIESGQQWDAPNGWAPLQWVTLQGLRDYGEIELADEIATRWLAMVDDHYRATGLLVEKYDVERRTGGGGGEYGNEIGFGWTNGVTAELIARTSLSR